MQNLKRSIIYFRKTASVLLTFLLFCAFLQGDDKVNSKRIPKPKNVTGQSVHAPGTPTSTVTATESFHWCRVNFNQGDCALAHPIGDTNLLAALKSRTGMEVDQNWYVEDLGNLEGLVKHPLIFMNSQRGFNCSEKELANIKEYLNRGGFIFADDCVLEGDKRGDLFFVAFKDKMEKLFGVEMVKLPKEHEIYHCVYDMPDGLPHMQGYPHGGWALFLNGRMAVFLSASDIHCGWTGWWCTPEKNELSLRMGINIIVYAMTR